MSSKNRKNFHATIIKGNEQIFQICILKTKNIFLDPHQDRLAKISCVCVGTPAKQQGPVLLTATISLAIKPFFLISSLVTLQRVAI